MKKIFNFVLCAGAAFLAVTGCQKDMDTTSGSEARVVSFCATEMETKTQFGDKAGNKYPTLWTTNQKVLVNLSYRKGLELEVTPSDDCATTTFNGDFSSVTEGPYTFMSVSPASAKDVNFNEENYTVRFNIYIDGVDVGFGFNPTGGNNRFNYFPSDKWDDKSRVSLYKYVE